jgi:hypothetical protein
MMGCAVKKDKERRDTETEEKVFNDEEDRRVELQRKRNHRELQELLETKNEVHCVCKRIWEILIVINIDRSGQRQARRYA